MLFEACGDGSEMLQPIEEALDEIAETVEEGAESRDIDASRHRFDIGPGAAVRQILAQCVAVIGTIRREDLPLADFAQHVGGASAVMSLAFRQLQSDRQAIGVDKGVDLRGQTAPRAPHASGVSAVASGGIRTSAAVAVWAKMGRIKVATHQETLSIAAAPLRLQLRLAVAETV